MWLNKCICEGSMVWYRNVCEIWNVNKWVRFHYSHGTLLSGRGKGIRTWFARHRFSRRTSSLSRRRDVSASNGFTNCWQINWSLSEILRVVQTKAILLLKSMSERGGSDIERLWNWISRSTQNDAISLSWSWNSILGSFYVGSAKFQHWFLK